jgi:carboxymethylenebutenolidase
MKTVKRILIGLGIALITLIFLLVGSVLMDYAVGGQRLAAVTTTTIPGYSGAPDVRAYVARPQGVGPFPVVIMIHEFFGLNESIVGKAQGLAEEGYLVVAPDTFRGSTTAWIPRAIFQVITTRPEQINQDLDSVYAWIQGQPDALVDRTGVVGFCYGGRASLSYSLHNPKMAATVIFYGSPETNPQILGYLGGAVLGIFGGADNSIPLDQVRAFDAALDEAGIPNEVMIYEGQPHAFVTDIASIRAGGVQAEAWSQMLAFLEQYLKFEENALSSKTAVEYDAPFDWGYYLRLVLEHTFGTPTHAH